MSENIYVVLCSYYLGDYDDHQIFDPCTTLEAAIQSIKADVQREHERGVFSDQCFQDGGFKRMVEVSEMTDFREIDGLAYMLTFVWDEREEYYLRYEVYARKLAS